MNTIIITAVTLIVICVAFGCAYLANTPCSIRNADGTVSIKYRSAPMKEYLRMISIVVVSVIGAVAFSAAISI